MTIELTYGVYISISVALTVWVAQTLFKNGRVFLVDVFAGNESLADSVNHLLVVGFYLVNLGWVSLMLKIEGSVKDNRDSIEQLSWKLGIVLLVLGVMHFTNLVIFTKIRGNQFKRRQSEEWMEMQRKVSPPPRTYQA